MRVNKSFERFTITNLTLYLIIGYVIGYLFQLYDAFRGTDIISMMTLDPWKIIHGQVWRLISWVLIPPSDYTSISGFFFILLMMWCCLSIGTTLERTWGTIKYNMFIFGGILFSIVGAFVCLGLFFLNSSYYGVSRDDMIIILDNGYRVWNSFSTYYINMSIYILFALTYPNMMVRLFFFLPVKMKWLGVLDGCYFAYYLFVGLYYSSRKVENDINVYAILGNIMVAAVLACLINIFIFWLSHIKNGKLVDVKQKRRQYKFRSEYNKGTATFKSEKSGRFSGGGETVQPSNAKQMRPSGISKHKCAVCGQTSESNPNLDFRFCSKCNGNYEYCSEHLFSHLHK